MSTNIPTSRPASSADRDSFLDALRAIAILRVVVWHTYGAAWISYFVASLPVMFFVAGSLMALSLKRGGAIDVLFRRFRRLLIPLWVMGIVAISVMAAYDHFNESFAATVPWRHVIWWVFPVWDPGGSDWGITWWAPLWYLRCLTWLLLASPLLLWTWRLLGPSILAFPVAALVLLEARLNDGQPVGWQLQDAALYSFFWLLGFAYNDGLLQRLPRRLDALLCAGFAAAAAAWALTQDVPANIVNASYPLHLLVALAWLFGFMTLRGGIARFAVKPRVDAVIYWVNERALTIYLWHAAGLFAMYQLLWSKPYSSLTRDLAALPIVIAVTFLAVLIVGWVEDVASGRSPRLWPARRTTTDHGARRRLLTFGLPAGALAVAGGLALLWGAVGVVEKPSTLVQPTSETVPASGVGLRIRTERAQITKSRPVREQPGDKPAEKPAETQKPSGAGETKTEGASGESAEATRGETTQSVESDTLRSDGGSIESAAGESSTSETAESTEATTETLRPVTTADLQAQLDAWNQKWGLGLTVSLQRASGEHWSGSIGMHLDESPHAVGEEYWTGSVTKTFTTALILRLAERGMLSLDDPVSNFVPEFPDSDRFTVRQLIQHTSGLIIGDETPYDALVAAAHDGLQFEPGSAFLYSRAGYYMLGLIIEERLGKSYTAAVHEELIDALELRATRMDEEVQPLRASTHPYAPLLEGLPGVTWSSGGLFKERSAEVDYHGLHWSSGGLFSTTDDLARWAVYLWGTDRVVTYAMLYEMTTFLAPEFDLTGLGTFPACPCWFDGDRLQAERWGHLGATGSIEYDPVDQIGLAMHVTGDITDPLTLEALDELSATLRTTVRGREIAVETVDSSVLAQADPGGPPSVPVYTPRSCDEIAGGSYASERERLYFLSACDGIAKPALGVPEGVASENVTADPTSESAPAGPSSTPQPADIDTNPEKKLAEACSASGVECTCVASSDSAAGCTRFTGALPTSDSLSSSVSLDGDAKPSAAIDGGSSGSTGDGQASANDRSAGDDETQVESESDVRIESLNVDPDAPVGGAAP